MSVNESPSHASRSESLALDRAAAWLLLALGAGLALLLTAHLTAHNPWFTAWAGWVVAHLVAGRWLRRWVRGRRRRSALALGAAGLVAGTGVAVAELPLTYVSVTLASVPASETIWLRPDIDGDTLLARSARRSDRRSTVRFVLPAPLDAGPGLAKLYLGRRDADFTVERVAYGTDVLWWPVDLIAFAGASVAHPLQVDESTLRTVADTGARLSSTTGRRPSAFLTTNAAALRAHGSQRRAVAVHLGWFVLLTSVTAMVMFAPAPTASGAEN